MLVLSSSLDREVQAHKHFTGATNIYWLNELMRYVRSEGLLNNFRLYPMVARTNYGTGVTVRGLGKLTGNQMTLVNGPTWGAGGIEFDVATQYATVNIPSSNGWTSAYNGIRVVPTGASMADATGILGQFGSVSTGEAIIFHTGNTALLSGEVGRIVFLSGGSVPILGSSSLSWTALEDLHLTQELLTTGSKGWKNKSPITYNLSANSATTSADYTPSSTSDGTNNWYLMSGYPIAQAFAGTCKATWYCNSTLTTLQRETITDLINAL